MDPRIIKKLQISSQFDKKIINKKPFYSPCRGDFVGVHSVIINFDPLCTVVAQPFGPLGRFEHV
jgi:hypothetical protein